MNKVHCCNRQSVVTRHTRTLRIFLNIWQLISSALCISRLTLNMTKSIWKKNYVCHSLEKTNIPSLGFSILHVTMYLHKCTLPYFLLYTDLIDYFRSLQFTLGMFCLQVWLITLPRCSLTWPRRVWTRRITLTTR